MSDSLRRSSWIRVNFEFYFCAAKGFLVWKHAFDFDTFANAFGQPAPAPSFRRLARCRPCQRALLGVLASMALWVGMASAQPLPKIELRPVFPELKTELPVGMVEAPDGSSRFFLLE